MRNRDSQPQSRASGLRRLFTANRNAGLIVAFGAMLAVVFVLENGVRGSIRKLLFVAVVLTFFVAVAFVTAKLQKVVGETVSSLLGALAILAAIAGFFLWLAANWGG